MIKNYTEIEIISLGGEPPKEDQAKTIMLRCEFPDPPDFSDTSREPRLITLIIGGNEIVVNSQSLIYAVTRCTQQPG